MNREEFFSIGQILKPHGIKGEVRVLSLSSFPERFKALGVVYIALKDKIEEYHLENVRFHKKFLLIKFKEIKDRNGAETLRGAEILIKERDLWKKEENFYYYHELYDLPCYLPKGEYLGVVVGIEEAQENVNLIIKEKDGWEHSIPFAKEFVKVERGKKIIIKPIPGLLSKDED